MRRRKFFYDTEFIEQSYESLHLISIGVVSEEGDTFYACNLDADLDQANDWVKENVIPNLPKRSDSAWMPFKEISSAFLNFTKPSRKSPIELWGYYADYDHVLLCWLFGKMIDLPEGIPQFTLDLRQWMMHLNITQSHIKTQIPQINKHNALDDAKWNLKVYQYLKETKRGKESNESNG